MSVGTLFHLFHPSTTLWVELLPGTRKGNLQLDLSIAASLIDSCKTDQKIGYSLKRKSGVLEDGTP
jgi:hypothetical protein